LSIVFMIIHSLYLSRPFLLLKCSQHRIICRGIIWTASWCLMMLMWTVLL